MTQELLETRATSLAADGSIRRWTHELEDLQNRARRLNHNGERTPPAAVDLLEDAFSFCMTMLQELAGAQLQHKRLQADVRRSDLNWNYLFDRLPLAALITDSVGTIVTANRAAALLLNTSAKHLSGKLLLHFVVNRERFALTLQGAVARQTRVEETLTIRPKERAARPMTVVIVPESAERSDHFLWFLPIGLPQARALPVEDAGEQPVAS
jgi:PAS domain-containing protein